METETCLIWTAESILMVLKKTVKHSVYEKMRSRIEKLMGGDRRRYFDEDGLHALLKQAHVSDPILFPDSQELLDMMWRSRNQMGSAEYLGFQNGLLDLLRDPVILEHSGPDERYFSIQEKLNYFARLGFYEFVVKRKYRDIDEMSRVCFFYEVEKIAQQCSEIEIVDGDAAIGWCMIDLRAMEFTQYFDKFMNDIRAMDRKKMKGYFVEHVFGKIGEKRHYLVDYFEELYDTLIKPYEAEIQTRNKLNVNPEIFIQGFYIAQQYVGKYKNLFLRGSSYSSDISYMKDNGRKPILRSIRYGPSAENKYFFTAEVVRAINFVHKIKGTMKVFSNQGDIVKLDADDEFYHMMNLEDLNKVLEVEKLSLDDLKIIDSFPRTTSLELVQSPKNTLSVFAGTAVIEIFKIMSRETDQFLNLDVQHFDKLRFVLYSMLNAFDVSRDDIHTVNYNFFLERAKRGTNMLRSLVSRKKPFQPVEREKVMLIKNIWSRIDEAYQLSKKFTYFKVLFDKFYVGVERIKLGEVIDQLPELLLCAFYGDFPEYAVFVHRQKACFHMPKCALTYVPFPLDEPMRPEIEVYSNCQFHPSANAPKLSGLMVTSNMEKVEKEGKENEFTVRKPLTELKHGFLNSLSEKKVEQNLPTYEELAQILEETKKKLEYEKTQRIENMNKFREDSDARLEEIRKLVLQNVTLEQEKKILEKSQSELQKYYETCSKKLEKAEKEQKLVKAEFEKKLEQEKEKRNVDLKKVENEADSLRETIKKLELEQKRMLNVKQANYQKAEKLEVELAGARKENARLQANIERSTNKPAELEAEVAKLRKENGRLRGNMERTENICERLRQEFNDGLDTIADLEANLRTAESALKMAKKDENSLLKEMGEYLKLLDENDFIMAAKLQLESFVEKSGTNLDREEYEMALWKFDKFSDSVKSFHEKVMDNFHILAKYPNLERSQLKQLPQFPEPFTLKIMAKMEEKMRGEPPVLENQKAEKKEEEAPVCAICLEIMENQQSLIACRVCNNKVHRECFLKWESIKATCVFCFSAMRDDVAFPALS